MTTSLATLIDLARRTLRDEASRTWTDDELTDMWIEAIEAVSVIHPHEVIVQLTLTDDTYVYPVPAGIDRIFRIDQYDADSKFVGVLPQDSGNGPNGGWLTHAGILSIARATHLTGRTLELWGYGRWANFDLPGSGDDGGWWAGQATAGIYLDDGVSLGVIRAGAVFVVWANTDPIVTGADCSVEDIMGGVAYRLTFTSDGADVNVKPTDYGDIGGLWAVIHQVPAMPFVGE